MFTSYKEPAEMVGGLVCTLACMIIRGDDAHATGAALQQRPPERYFAPIVQQCYGENEFLSTPTSR